MTDLLQDFRSAFQRKNNTLVQLILINVSVFVVLVVLKVFLAIGQEKAIYSFIVSHLGLPAQLSKLLYQPWAFLTHCFMHEDIFHILSNMLFLYWFGLLIEEFIGSSRLLNLYILGGITGGVLYVLIYNFVPYFQPKVQGSLMIGASGATFAVVWGAATLLPDYVFRLLFIGYVRIKYIAWFYVFISFMQIVGDNAGGNIAHLGGALMGYFYIKQLRAGRDFGSFIQTLVSWLKREKPAKIEKKRVFSEVHINKNVSNPNTDSTDYVNQQEVDGILDKISRSGYESLSTDEKQKLFKASKQ